MITNIDTTHTSDAPTATIEFTLDNGTISTISNSDLWASPKLEINNRAVSGDSFEYGATYMGECKFAFLPTPQLSDRLLLFGAEICVTYSDSTGSVQKGIFYVTNAEREQGYISVEAHDGMKRLERPLSEDLTGKPYELLTQLCTDADLTLAQTRSTIQSYVNGNVEYRLIAEHISSAREAVSHLAKMMCCFVIMDGEGRLSVRPFPQYPDLTVEPGERKSLTISDANTRYSEVKAVFSDGKEYSAGAAVSDSLSMYLGDVPIVYGFSRDKQRRINAIYDRLSTVDYTPCEFAIEHNPYIEPGDCLLLSDVEQNGSTFDVLTYVMDYVWKFNADGSIKAVGDNPLISLAEDKASQGMSTITEQAKRNFAVQTTTNVSEQNIGSLPVQLLFFAVSALVHTTVVFIATVQFTMSHSGTVVFSYYIDGQHDDSADLHSEFKQGKHFVTLHRYINIDNERQHTVSILVHTEQPEQGSSIDTVVYTDTLVKEDDFYLDGEFDNCKYRADIPFEGLSGSSSGAVEFDYETATSYKFAPIAIVRDGMISIYTRRPPRHNIVIPTIKIDRVVPGETPTMSLVNQAAGASLFGQGISSDTWSGNITAYDSIPRVDICVFEADIDGMTETVTAHQPPLQTSGHSENIIPVSFGAYGFCGITEEAYVNRTIYDFNIDLESFYDTEWGAYTESELITQRPSDYIQGLGDDIAFRLTTSPDLHSPTVTSLSGTLIQCEYDMQSTIEDLPVFVPGIVTEVTDDELMQSTKALITDADGTVYIVYDGELMEVTGLSAEMLTEQDVIDYAFDCANLTPRADCLFSLGETWSIYMYNANGITSAPFNLITHYSAAPQHNTKQVLIDHPSITGIEKITAQADGNPLFAIKFGDENTWYAHNGTSWQALTDDVTGMTGASLSLISVTQWNEKLYNNGVKVDSITIRFVLPSVDDGVYSILIDFTN